MNDRYIVQVHRCSESVLISGSNCSRKGYLSAMLEFARRLHDKYDVGSLCFRYRQIKLIFNSSRKHALRLVSGRSFVRDVLFGTASTTRSSFKASYVLHLRLQIPRYLAACHTTWSAPLDCETLMSLCTRIPLSSRRCTSPSFPSPKPATPPSGDHSRSPGILGVETRSLES